MAIEPSLALIAMREALAQYGAHVILEMNNLMAGRANTPSRDEWLDWYLKLADSAQYKRVRTLTALAAGSSDETQS